MIKDVKICPECGSTNLSGKGQPNVAGSMPVFGYDEGIHTNKCLDCDYTGICPTIPVKDLQKIRRQIKKK